MAFVRIKKRIEIVKMLFAAVALIGVSCFVVNGQDGNSSTNLNGESFNGKLKSLEEECWKVDANSQDTILRSELVYKFSELGRLIERRGFGQLCTYKYDSSGRLIQSDVCGGDGKNCIVSKNVYDENGNLIKDVQQFPESTAKRKVFFEKAWTYYRYDEESILIEQKRFKKEVSLKKDYLSEHLVYEYDSLGNRIVEKEFDESGNLLEKTENTYSDTLLTEAFTWMEFEEEDLYQKTSFDYFGDGKLRFKWNRVYDYGSTTSVVAEYTTEISYEFDDQQRCVKKIVMAIDTKEQQFFDFDFNDNWQKMIESDSKGTLIVFRKLEYWD